MNTPATPVSRGDGYFKATRRPIYSAILVLPFLVVYEVGMYLLKPGVLNGGDALIQRLLAAFSVHFAFASALVLLACFLVWQTWTGASWQVKPAWVALSFAESLFFAVVLFFVLGWLSVRLPAPAAAVAGPSAPRGLGTWGTELSLYCGAGVYEELVFRVLLMGLLLLVFTKLVHMEELWAAVWAVVIGSALFSLFHYIGPEGEKFRFNSFVQRGFAGVYFAALYTTRSFGIAAAAHAMYDILVGATQR